MRVIVIGAIDSIVPDRTMRTKIDYEPAAAGAILGGYQLRRAFAAQRNG
jgi:hypothetical protein